MNQIAIAILCNVSLLAAVTSIAGADQKQTPYEVNSDYKSYIAGDGEVVVWYGKRVALVLDDEPEPEQRNAETMKAVLGALDDVAECYDRVTGRRPRLTAPLNGRIRIEVSSKVGGGLAHHGRLGVAIGDGFFRGSTNDSTKENGQSIRSFFTRLLATTGWRI